MTAGAQIPTGIQVGHGVRPVATQRLFTQGTFQQTDNPFDLVIEGDGFFQVLLPDGTIAYTRMERLSGTAMADWLPAMVSLNRRFGLMTML